MVRLNPAQTEIRDRITAQKKRYDSELAIIEGAYVNAKEEAKQPLRTLVAEAQDANIPQRQIHLAFGFEQLSSLVSFLMPSKRFGGSLLYTGMPTAGGAANPVSAAIERAQNVQPEVTQDKTKHLAKWVDPETGKKRSVSRMVFGNEAYVDETTWERLSEAERALLLADTPRLLIGMDEYDQFNKDGTEPALWSE